MGLHPPPVAAPSPHRATSGGRDRRTIEVGTLSVNQIYPEPEGPCRDINFDPAVLPTGI